MERLDSIDKPNRKPNFTLSQDVDLDKLFRDEFRARYGHCVVPAQSDKDSIIVKITPPSLP